MLYSVPVIVNSLYLAEGNFSNFLCSIDVLLYANFLSLVAFANSNTTVIYKLFLEISLPKSIVVSLRLPSLYAVTSICFKVEEFV